MIKQQSLEGIEFINFHACCGKDTAKLIKTEITDADEELSLCKIEMENAENVLVDAIKQEEIVVTHTDSNLIKTELKSEGREEYDIKSEEILYPPFYLQEGVDIKSSSITAIEVSSNMDCKDNVQSTSCNSNSKELDEQWQKREANRLSTGDSTVTRQGKNISFNCFHCDFSTNFRGDLVSHMLVHSESKKELFPSTNHDYTSNSKQHMIRRHSGKYSCKGCKKHFKNQRSLHDHVIKHHRNLIDSISKKVHSCMACDYKTTRKYNMKRHMAKVHLGNHEKHLCRGCEKQFKNRRSLDDHVIKNHHYLIDLVSSKVLSCSRCNYKTTKRDHLNKHRTYAHSEDYEKHPCRGCEKHYSNKESLDDHILKSHQDFMDLVSSEVHSCPECDYKTTKKSYFTKHMNVHSENCEKYFCKGCEKHFKDKQSLDDHIIKNHHDFVNSISSKVHSCTGCDYKTTKKGHLRQHLKVHSIN